MNPNKMLPLSMPRRFAIALLHRAQLAGDTGFVVAIGAGAEPDTVMPIDPSADLVEQLVQVESGLTAGERGLWALYLHRPAMPSMPVPADFDVRPELLRLTASLATKGVLQLRAWRLNSGQVNESDLHIRE